MAEQPSLTPHRDHVERMIAAHAGKGRASDWRGRMATAAGYHVQRLIADARDGGLSDEDIAVFAPSLLRAVAENICAAFGMVDFDDRAPTLLGAAASPHARPSKSSVSNETRVAPARGGRA